MKLTLTINADGNVNGVVRGVNNNVSKLTNQTKAATVQADRLGSSIKRIGHYGAAAFGGWGLARVTSDVISSADAFSAMEGQLKLVTDSSAELAYVQGELNRVSFETRGDITSMTKLYSALSPTFKEMGKSTEDSTRLVELYNKSLALTSPSATESASATLQFAQAMGSGVLRGEEFNSIMENGRGVAMMLAEGLDVPIGSLRAMAEQGELTADVVVSALERQADIIEEKFTNIPLTVSGAWQNVRTQTMLYVGETDQAVGATQTLAESLNVVAQNVDTIANGMAVAGVVISTSVAGKLTQMTVAKVADMRATTAATVAEEKRLASLVRLADRQHAAAVDELNLANLRKQTAVTTSQVAAAERARSLAIENVANKQLALRTATSNYNQVAGRATAVATGLRGAMSLLGGPVGIGLAVASFAAYSFASEEAQENTQEMIDRVSMLTGKYDELSRSQTQQALKQINADIEVMRAKVFTSQDKSLWDVMFGDPDEMRKQSEEQFAAYQKLIQGRKELQKQLADQGSKNPSVANPYSQNLKAAEAEEKAWIEAVKQYHQEYRDELAADAAAAELYRQNTIDGQWDADNAAFDKMDNQDTGTEAFQQQIDDFTVSVTGLGDAWTKTGDAASEAMGNMMLTFDEYQKSQSDSAKAQEKIDELRFENLDRLSKELISLNEFEQNEAKLNIQQANLKAESLQDQMELYYGLAGAVSQYFEKGSAEAEAFKGVQQSLALFDGIRAVVNAWAAPYPTNLVQVPLTIAAVGGLLSQMGVSFSGGSGSGATASEGFKSRGDGGRLGNDEASTSVTDAYSRMEELEADQYTELRGIYSEMKDLNNNMQGVISSLYRTGDLEGLGAYAGSSSYAGQDFIEGVFGAEQDFIDGIFGEELGGLVSIFGGIGDHFGNALGTVASGLMGSVQKEVHEYGLLLEDFRLGSELDLKRFETHVTYRDQGWGRDTKRSESDKVYDIAGESERMINLVFDNMRDSMIDMGTLLDRNVQDVVDDFVISIGKIDIRDMTADEINQAFSAQISTQADALATDVFGDLVRLYAKVNESAFDTVSRLGIDKTIAANILEMTNQTFGNLGADAIAVSQSLVEISGGIDALKESADSYYAEFFTEEEQRARATEQLTEALAAQNLQLPKTRDGYRALVESLNQGDAAAQEQYVSLMQLSDAATEYYDNMEDSAEALVQSSREALEATAGLVSDAYSTLQASINAEKATLQDALNDRLSALNAEKTVINDSVSALRQLQSTLESTYKSIINGTDGLDLMTYTSAQAQILNARATGNFTLDGISDALSVVGNNSADNYASRADYLRDQAITANAIGDLSDMTGAQLSTDEQMLASLDAQIDSARALYDTQVAALDAQLSYYDDAINGADDQLSVSESIEQLEQAMLDVLRDIRTATADTYDTLTGGDGLVDWTEFNSAFGGLATEATLKDVFGQLDINGDLYVDAIESVLGTLNGSGFDDAHISEYVNSIMSQYDAPTAQQMLTGAAVNSGTTAGQISTATGIDQTTVEQAMYDSWAAIDDRMTALTGGGDIDTGNANAASIYNYAMQMSLTPEQVASYMPDWSADHVRDFVSQNGWQALPEYFVGGHTGDLPIDKIAGVVHGQEYVNPAWQVKKHPELFAALETERVKGYQSGGPVSFSLPTFNASSSGFERTEKLIEKLIDRIDQLEEQAARTAVATEQTVQKLKPLKQGIPTYNMVIPNA
ncbi:hypothetical protein AVO42_00485 [Thiomicrospira sp. XS5]|uniref:tape measure protein n=1 Tax=Thiomicrospira sp. XS5 TaxID=1775636 RepID=UPI00074726D5|nr:tape measure protein [Thiomicrospira sp. XS5]KUJ73933.1 hypothetical protein AVO42_00485 [Thiomicrospira sp. XS5]